MFKQQKPKNAFLQKKNLEKAKLAEQQKQKANALKLQKNIRAFLWKQKLLSQVISTRNIRFNLIMKSKLQLFTEEQVNRFIESLQIDLESTKDYYYSQFVLQNVREQRWTAIAIDLLNQPSNKHLRSVLIRKEAFVQILADLFERGKAPSFLNISFQEVRQSQILMNIDSNIILRALLSQFREEKMQLENIPQFNTVSVLLLIETLWLKDHIMKNVKITQISTLSLFYINSISKKGFSDKVERVLCYLYEQVLRVGLQNHEEIASRLIKQNQNIVSLIEDEEMMIEIESKLKKSQAMEEFTNSFLGSIRTIMTHPTILELFYQGSFKVLHEMLLKMVNDLSVLFESHKLIFIRQIISSDSVLTSLAHSRDPMFQEGLKMRLLGMDDPEFKAFDIFSQQQWRNIIRSCVQVADIKIQKIIEYSPKQAQQLTPFKKRNKDQLELKTVVDLLSNLHKKVLRTGKFSPQYFVDYGLSGQLKHFLFGKGAMKIEQFLKQMPFLFSFESRIGKFKQFVKADKANYDRSLFLQEQVDDDLIIAVRRGHEFMDAFEACMARDLRKKYKIIFFNQQGLEEEGIDGGGIIKEFINRVLKSAFSQTYSLFMDTPLNEILPNPYSNAVQEYQFVGKLVGKAVYQGITIQQKFAQPFLNLLIGRQNTFEELQFIDPDIYRSLVALKNTTEDISSLQQTFVIYDHLPTGQKRYIDLLCPSKPPSGKQVLVTNQNKMDFILSYANFKCNIQIEEKTRLFRKGFLKVIKPQWLTMFSNQQLNAIISGSNPDFNVAEMKQAIVYKDYHQKDPTIVYFWQVVQEMKCEQKSLLLLYITSCSRPPTLGFVSMKPKICIQRDNDPTHLPTANTCMNVLRLPDYKNRELLKKKLMYAINAKAGFQFA